MCQKPTQYLYTYQIKLTNTSIAQTEKWKTSLESQNIPWKRIFKLPYEITVNNKLRNFHYKYIMRIVRTNKELYRFALVNSTICDFCCQNTETIHHLFWECIYSQELWNNISNIFRRNDVAIELNYHKISLGIIDHKYNTPLNYIILLAKYYIFRCKCVKEKPNFSHFKNYSKF